jgi:hypothetical protein
MRRRFMRAILVFAVLLAAAQLVRPERSNPPIDARRTIQAHSGTASGLGAILERSCNECHSDATVWPWYSKVAPLSWLMARAVAEGRATVNFSEWADYSPTQLASSCEAVSKGRMPGAWTLVRPDARLSVQDVETICAAARQAEARAADVGSQP